MSNEQHVQINQEMQELQQKNTQEPIHEVNRTEESSIEKFRSSDETCHFVAAMQS